MMKKISWKELVIFFDEKKDISYLNKASYFLINNSFTHWKLTNKIVKISNKNFNKLKNKFPIEYLTKSTTFKNLNLKIKKGILIPREETEYLVDLVLENSNLNNLNVLEIGSGTGAISIALKKANNKLNIYGIDISRKAIKYSKINSKINNTDIRFKKQNFFSMKSVNKYDVIVSNPPYIEIGDFVEIQTKLYEPKKALFIKNTKIYFEHFFKKLKQLINQNSFFIYLEISHLRTQETLNAAKLYFPGDKINIKQDIYGNSRYLIIIKNDKT